MVTQVRLRLAEHLDKKSGRPLSEEGERPPALDPNIRSCHEQQRTDHPSGPKF